MTLSECMALLLLYRNCADGGVRRRVEELVPELDDATEVLDALLDDEAGEEDGPAVP